MDAVRRMRIRASRSPTRATISLRGVRGEIRIENMNPFIVNDSCPDCGFVPEKYVQMVNESKPFDCPRCGAHYSREDFHKECREKFMAQKHNHAKADLTQEGYEDNCD